MCNHDILFKSDSRYSFDGTEYFECWDDMNCGAVITLDNRPVYQCEMCNCFFSHEYFSYPDPDSKHRNCKFCSDDCAEEAYQEVVWSEREAQREYECYGDDIDSWYR